MQFGNLCTVKWHFFFSPIFLLRIANCYFLLDSESEYWEKGVNWLKIHHSFTNSDIEICSLSKCCLFQITLWLFWSVWTPNAGYIVNVYVTRAPSLPWSSGFIICFKVLWCRYRRHSWNFPVKEDHNIKNWLFLSWVMWLMSFPRIECFGERYFVPH